MEHLTLTVPSLWADHHVLRVREALGALAGVDAVTASALNREVSLSYNQAQVNADAIVEHLAAAGYAVSEISEEGTAPRAKPEWMSNGLRVTSTNALDLAMSGDYRKY